MRQEFDERLCQEFPNLYGDRNGDKTQTLMCWGFSHGDGWFNIIYELSQKLEAAILKLPEEERASYRAVQVKEKFGTLRFYMSNWTDEMVEAIREAEERSVSTCEGCGAPGELRKGSWVHTYCDACEADRVQRLHHEDINRKLPKGKI